MVTFTVNKGLGLPAVGGDVGVWGGPLNNNSSVIDSALGGVTSISLSSVAGALTLLASNYQNNFLVLFGTLTQNTVVTLPNVGSFYTVLNLASIGFTVQLNTPGGGQVIAAPNYTAQDILTDGPNVRFKGLPPIGSYVDFAGASVPNWVTACTVNPYLNCDGSAFNAGTYPMLNAVLGGNVLPDARGCVRATLNQGTGRLTVPINGDVVKSIGGNQLLQSHAHSAFIFDQGHGHTVNAQNSNVSFSGFSGIFSPLAGTTATSVDGTGVRVWDGGTLDQTAAAGGGAGQNVQPTFIGGLTLIRAG